MSRADVNLCIVFSEIIISRHRVSCHGLALDHSRDNSLADIDFPVQAAVVSYVPMRSLMNLTKVLLKRRYRVA